MMKKRSIVLQGHSTSVALEEEFWNALEMIAQTKGCSVSYLLNEIDGMRSLQSNLASGLRLYVLAWYQENHKTHL